MCVGEDGKIHGFHISSMSDYISYYHDIYILHHQVHEKQTNDSSQQFIS